MNATHSPLSISVVVAAVLAASALTACGRQDERPVAEPTVGQQVDSAIASAREQTEAVQDKAAQQVAETRQDAAQAVDDMRQSGREVMDKAAGAVGDAAITASVNAELAKDPKLSALKIDVDTKGGRVALKGSAPDRESRDRATQLAAGVKGVSSVDNQLVVNANG